MAYFFLPWYVGLVVKFLLVSTLSLAVTFALFALIEITSTIF